MGYGFRIRSSISQAWVAGAARPASLMARVKGTELACGRIGRGGGRYILDAGADLRKPAHPNVIHLEIFDYPSTDIISTGQSFGVCSI